MVDGGAVSRSQNWVVCYELYAGCDVVRLCQAIANHGDLARQGWSFRSVVYITYRGYAPSHFRRGLVEQLFKNRSSQRRPMKLRHLHFVVGLSLAILLSCGGGSPIGGGGTGTGGGTVTGGGQGTGGSSSL